MSCPCCMVLPLFGVISACKESAVARAILFALSPALAVGAAIYTGAVEWETVRSSAECVMSCDCARSYAIGGALLWAILVQKVLRSGSEESKEPLPKSSEATALPTPEATKGGVAAKAA